MDITTAEHGGFTIQSTDTPEQVSEAVGKLAEAVQHPEQVEPGTLKAKPIPPAPDNGTKVQTKDQHGLRGENGRFEPSKGGSGLAKRGEHPEGGQEVGAEAGGPDRSDGADGGVQEPPKRSKAKERIHQLREEGKEHERLIAQERLESQRLRQELEQYRRQQQQAAQPEPQQRQADPGPREEDFPDWKSYQAAVIEHQVNQRLHAHMSEQKAQQYQQQMEHHVRTFRESVERAGGANLMSTIPAEIRDLKPSAALGQGEQAGPLNMLANQIMFGGDEGIALMKHLAANMDQFRRISTARDPVEYGRIMGRIEAAISTATAGTSAEKAAKPEAPPFEPKGSPPITPVSGGSHQAESDADLDELAANGKISFAEYARRANARDRKRSQRA